jgi:hypothetical protein
MKIRATAGIILFVLVSLFSTIKLTKPAEQFAARFFGVTEIAPDTVTLSERRFTALRPLLPSRGTIGYATDDGAGSYAAHERYLIVRYALAPILVENSPSRALVVGNLVRPETDLHHLARQHNLTLLKDLGDGVLLFEGVPR